MFTSSYKVIIAGAGLGGLAAAGCLIKAGFDVEIYEQAPVLGEIGAGIQQSANAMHVMRYLGVEDELRAASFEPPTTQFRVYHSGEILQELSLAQNHEQRHGAPYLQLHRADFHAILARRMQNMKPDLLHLDAAAVGFEEAANHVTLLLADGRRIKGDIIIGADGIKSSVRRQIAGADNPQYTGDAAWRLTVPRNRLPEGFMNYTSSIWVGPNKHAVVYFLRGGALLNFVACVELDEWIEESWTLKRPWTELRADFEGWHADILKIIDAADRNACYRWALNVRPPLCNWSTERVALIGDAAHPTLPYLAQGAAMAVEDGAILARALRLAPDIPQALRLYQQNRIPRTTRIIEESLANRQLFHLKTINALKAAFSRRNLDRERSDWLYSYNPLKVPLETAEKNT